MRLFVRRMALGGILTALLVSACDKETPPARAQWVVAVQTDAPVPTVVDRILLELLDETGALACPSCRRDAAAHGPGEQAVSFGVEATSKALYLRTRVYRSDHLATDTGQPDPRLTLDGVVRLPEVGDRVITVYSSLKLACLGKPATIPSAGTGTWSTCVDGVMQQPPEAALEPHDPAFQPGTSPLLQGIRRGGCVDTNDDMACIPGGAFFLGSTLAPAPHSDVEAAPIPERLVGVHAFRIDRHEVTVDQFRSKAQELIDRAIVLPGCGEDQPATAPIKLWCRDPSKDQQMLCSMSDDPTVSTALPMNCLSATLAAAYCAVARKGRLPTEAEWEYAASNGALETRFPWGDSRPDCSYAALARDPNKSVGDATASECLDDAEGGPIPQWQPGTLRDQTSEWTSEGFKTRSLFDMGGNVAEWTSDYFETYDAPQQTDAGVAEAGLDGAAAEAGLDGSSADAQAAEAGLPDAGTGSEVRDKCWAPDEVILIDRRCRKSKPSSKLVIRGGSWRETLDGAWAANRASLSDRPLGPPQDVGFRCACDLDQNGNCCLKNKEGQCCDLRLNLVDKALECCVGPKCCGWDLIGARCTM